MPGLNTKSYYTGVVDNNDLAYVIERFGNPKRILPAPISRFKIGEYKGRPKINPHVSSFIMKDGRTVSVFHIKPIYYLHVNGEWRPLSEVTTYHGNRKLILNNKWEQIEPWYLRWLMKRCELIGGQVLIPWRFDNVPIREGQEIYFDTLTKYPDAGSGGSLNVDGDIWRENGGTETLANLRAGAGTVATVSATTISMIIQSSSTTDQFDTLGRGMTAFDTSALTANATISAAVISGYGSAASNGLGSPDLHIAQGTLANNNNVVTGDYAQANHGTTTFGNIAYASFSTTAYNDITFNATGRSAISKTGTSVFSWQLSWDINNSFTGSWLSANFSRLRIVSADAAGTTQDPKLVVTYTLPAAGALQGFNMTGFWGA